MPLSLSSIAIEENAVEIAQNAIQTDFEKEILNGQINKISIETDLSIVAIVGENMKQTTGIAGKLFSVTFHYRQCNPSTTLDGKPFRRKRNPMTKYPPNNHNLCDRQ